jgi:tetratricopeptide (TPR) repeat protein
VINRNTVWIALALALVASTSSLAIAQQAPPDAATLEAAKKHYADGQAKFNGGDMTGAVDDFKEAYRLTKNPVLLYNIGFVYDKLDDKSLALHYYQKFLRDVPDNEKTKEKREEVAARVADLERSATGAVEDPVEPPVVEPPVIKKPEQTGPDATELTHEVVEDAPPGKPLDVVVRAPRAWIVTLHYRGENDEVFTAAKMQPRFGELVGRVPASVMKGKSIHYYVEAKTSAGKQVGLSGRAGSPNIVTIDPKAPARYFSEVRDPEAPITRAPIVTEEPAPGADRPRSKALSTGKWVATASAGTLLAAGVTFYLMASSYATTLEGEAFASNTECGEPPCRTYTDERKSLESTGKSLSVMSNVTLAVGLTAAVAAGVLWYFDSRQPASRRSSAHSSRGRILIAPVVAGDVIGGAALITF